MNTLATLGLALAFTLLPFAVQAQGSCRAESGPTTPHLLELYTSEGCSSCPPADRFASSLRGRAEVVVAAFHVDYWDRLGWVDRFGSPRHTARQQASMAHSGARFAYTPQWLMNGQDWRDWGAGTRWPAPRTAPLRLLLQYDGAQASVRVQAGPGAPPPASRLWWAWLEDGHLSQVQAGENRGATLRHDHVVRHYGEPVALGPGLPQEHRWLLPTRERAGRLLVVLADAKGRPLQTLTC